MEDKFERLKYAFQNGNTRKILLEIIDLLADLWPYLLIGIIISSLIKIYFAEDKVKKYLSKNSIITIFLAACLGVISPLGAYVALPLAATFIALGTPLPPIIAFSIASPLINPGIFILTQGTLGLEMAITRVVSAIILGFSAGLTSRFFMQKFPLAFELKSIPGNDDYKNKIGDGTFSWKKFFNESYRYSRYILKHFLIGVFVAALAKVLVPPQLIFKTLGTNNNLSILLATGAGVPLYSCGGAALPVLKELLYLGVGKGTILAFCISGPAIKLSTLVLLKTLFKNGVIILYLGTTLAGAIILSLIYQYII